MRIYSRELFCSEIGPGLTALFTVPVGETWVIKDFSLELFSAADYTAIARYGAFGFVSLNTTIYATQNQQVRGNGSFFPVEEGESVVAYTTGSGLGCVVSGYKFTSI